MNKLIILIIALFVSTFTYAQINISPEEWRADLRFFQQSVHKDYDFLFKKLTSKEFDSEVEKLHESIPDLDEHEIIVGIARLVSMFKYGHTALWLPGVWEGKPFRFHQMPVSLYSFKDGIFVQGVHKDYAKVLGAKVVAVEGMPVEKALATIKPTFPAENDQFFKAHGMSYLVVPEILHAQGITKSLKNTITLSLEKDGKSFDQTFNAIDIDRLPGEYGFMKHDGDWLSARDISVTPHYLKNLDRIYYFEYLPEQKAVYVRHSQIQDDEEEAIPEFYERLFNFIDENEVDKLILDVRLNGGGNNYKNKPIVTGVIQSEKINKPGKFFVIIGRRTFSACQNLVNELDNYTEAVFVGEPTGENINFYGDNRELVLPNSHLSLDLSFAWWQDKPQWENGPWTPPHVAVEMTFDEYRTNQDPVLETALNFTDDNFILDPMKYLTGLYEKGEQENLQAEAVRLINDPNYAFFDFEDEFNILGYNLMNRGDLETANTVFNFVVSLFPDSANAWDSLAECYMRGGQNEKAVEYYNKAISMDPDGSVGENARNMLRKIEGGK